MYKPIATAFFFSLLTCFLLAQDSFDVKSLYDGLEFRNIGPSRGGRSVASCGVPGNSQMYYMGSTGGGLWKTTDAGLTWKNISDGFFKMGSVGTVEVAPSDINVISELLTRPNKFRVIGSRPRELKLLHIFVYAVTIPLLP